MTAAPTLENKPRRCIPDFARSSWFWIGLFLVLVALALGLPMNLPLGANYWDTAIYLDAAQRLDLGQRPYIDFAAPVGPLGYYLAATGFRLFSQTSSMLVVQLCITVVTLPVLAILVAHMAPRSARDALALTLPFLLFSLFPMNLHDLYPMPGFDGYGYYNRHTSLLLYLFVVTVIFVDSARLRIGLMAGLILLLFLTKITGVVAALLIAGVASVAGRLKLRELVWTALIVLGALGVLEAATGMVSAYLGTILHLLAVNNGTLFRRILTVASVKFNVVGPALLLIAVSIYVKSCEEGSFARKAAAFLRSPAALFAGILLALAVFETQNTGSLEFLGLWPALLLLLSEWRLRPHPARPLIMVLVGAVALPSLVIYLERSARAVFSAPAYQALDLPHLRGLGKVLAKPDIIAHGAAKLAHYARNQVAYEGLARQDILPSYVLFSEFDYQASWLMSVEEAVMALQAYEKATGQHFKSLYALDFTDPFNWLLNRRPPRYVQIGLDPGRTTQAPDPRLFKEIYDVDALLVPLCPVTSSRKAIETTFAAALADRQTVRLSRCWEMRLR